MGAPEPVRWLIDGNNVMGSRPDGWWRDRRGAARRLAAELELHSWPEGAEVTVVFDGPGGTEDDGTGPDGAEGESAAVQVVHAGAHRSADDAIVGLAAADDRPVVVVTSDRGLRDRVRALGAEVVPSRGLLDRLGRGQARRPR